MPKMEKVKVNVKERLDDNTIDLSLSELTEIPVKDIAALKRATILDLSNNKIAYLGKTFTTLSHLTKLDLSKNQIKFLPDDFGNLRNLRHLDLYNNRLEHLPLSFGNLINLRYLDLKANPLTPALAKIVGQCLTSKDCNESAKNTVKFLARMQKEFEVAKAKLREENDSKIEEIEEKKIESPKAKKNKKNKSKNKKNKNDNNSDSNEKDNGKTNHKYVDSSAELQKSNSVFKTVLTFFFLLILNILMLYIVIVKYPDIGDKLVEIIPPHYRDLVLNYSENIKLNFLRVSDWVQKFRTPPS